MQKYRIKMDGHVYEMEVELIASEEGSPVSSSEKVQPAPAAPAARPAPEAKAAPAPRAAVPLSGSGCRVSSPMPGMIIHVQLEEGAAVQAGQTVLILEAMKMENEITAPRSGVLRQVSVKKGQVVAGGDFLFEIV